MTVVAVPQFSIAMEEAVVLRWLVADGANVGIGQPVAELETDKATLEVEAPAAGTITILAEPGAVVPVGGALAEIGAGAVTVAGIAASPVSKPAGTSLALPLTIPSDFPDRRIASPAARRVAAERGVDLSAVMGSGPSGRIVVRDIPARVPGGARRGQGERRRAVVRNIVASWEQIPHIHVGGELDASGLVAAREAARAVGVAATVTDLLLVALVRALRSVPELRAVVGPDGTATAGTTAVAVAVATSDGVVAPVIRDIEGMTLAEVSAARSRLVAAARGGDLDGKELVGASITLSNLGAYPVDFFAPVISGPQAALVATGRVAERVVAEHGQIGVRPTIWVNVAVDHRAADGEAGGRLLRALEASFNDLPGGVR